MEKMEAATEVFCITLTGGEMFFVRREHLAMAVEDCNPSYIRAITYVGKLLEMKIYE